MFVEVIVAVGESKSTVRSAEFHWYKLQWGEELRTLLSYSVWKWHYLMHFGAQCVKQHTMLTHKLSKKP